MMMNNLTYSQNLAKIKAGQMVIYGGRSALTEDQLKEAYRFSGEAISVSGEATLDDITDSSALAPSTGEGEAQDGGDDESLTVTRAQFQAEVDAAVDAETKPLQEHIEVLEAGEVQLQSQVTGLQNENTGLKADVVARDATITDRETTITALNGQIKTLNDQVTSLQNAQTASVQNAQTALQGQAAGQGAADTPVTTAKK